MRAVLNYLWYQWVGPLLLIVAIIVGVGSALAYVSIPG